MSSIVKIGCEIALENAHANQQRRTGTKRALEVLQNLFECSLSEVHKRRRDAVLLMCGGKLWLTAWGRSMPGSTSDKHRIKAADRLLGNQKLHSDLSLFFRALAHRLIGRIERPVIAIDWTDRNAGILQLQNLL